MEEMRQIRAKQQEKFAQEQSEFQTRAALEREQRLNEKSKLLEQKLPASLKNGRKLGGVTRRSLPARPCPAPGLCLPALWHAGG